MTYTIEEIFFTLQGEGVQVGRAAVFCRFAGCNLWSGREQDRANAVCRFCDTDFVGSDGTDGGKYHDPSALAAVIAKHWPDKFPGRRFVVCTGGEPLLQLDEELIKALHEHGFEIAVETNGTIAPPSDLDWICVSPKAGAALRLTQGNELKVVVPQDGLDPVLLEDLEFDHFSIQPMDGPERDRNLRHAIEFCLTRPQWRLSLQTHKVIGIR
jgi:7-carboxy-7-deazaguanine synthase